MSDKNQKLVLAILDFLNTSIDDGTVKADDKEGLEVAGKPQDFPTHFRADLMKSCVASSAMYWGSLWCRS